MVAWWDDEDATAEDVLPHLTGRDVHHESGVEWDNREDNLVLMDHGRHSEITQAQIRAWGEDAKRQATADGGETPAEDSCAECDATEHLYRCADYDGLRCAVHAAQASDGSPMEAV